MCRLVRLFRFYSLIAAVYGGCHCNSSEVRPDDDIFILSSRTKRLIERRERERERQRGEGEVLGTW